MDRRDFIARTALGAAALALPVRVHAAPAPDARSRQILDIARREVERAGSVLWRRDIAGIADFGLHSAMPRFHMANLEAGTVESLRVAHGSGSDPEHDGWLNTYANIHGSNATSRGAYVSWEWYTGKYGTSVRLGGLDPTNDQAFTRAIVAHAASYATPEHVAQWGRLGRSNGCFAFAPDDFRQVLLRLSGGRLLYAETLGIGEDGRQVARPDQIPVDFSA